MDVCICKQCTIFYIFFQVHINGIVLALKPFRSLLFLGIYLYYIYILFDCTTNFQFSSLKEILGWVVGHTVKDNNIWTVLVPDSLKTCARILEVFLDMELYTSSVFPANLNHSPE